ncbi:LuxR C-terminal-related transcriptional regulator [Pseudomonas chlororaphis]|uniref:response regulator transcription factor n=1 Tax=Pseudomonas chlororaphis TaxID=587753 RepID=UPI0035D4CB0A
MTNREIEVLRLLLQGKTNKQIARELEISNFTVRDHISSIFQQHKVNSRTELFAKRLERINNLIHSPPQALQKHSLDPDNSKRCHSAKNNNIKSSSSPLCISKKCQSTIK